MLQRNVFNNIGIKVIEQFSQSQMFGRSKVNWDQTLGFCFVLLLSLKPMIKAPHYIPSVNFQFRMQDSSINISLLSPTKSLTKYWFPPASVLVLLKEGLGANIVIGCLLLPLSLSTSCSERRSLPESLMRLAIQ